MSWEQNSFIIENEWKLKEDRFKEYNTIKNILHSVCQYLYNVYSYFFMFSTVVDDHTIEDDFLLIMLWTITSIFQIASLEVNKKVC